MTILSLIEKYYERFIWISPGRTSPYNAYKTLKEDPDFLSISKNDFKKALNNLLVQNKLIIERYKTKDRKDMERYKRALSAPTSILEVSAETYPISPCSAPSTTGGMGEERAEIIMGE